MEKRMVCKCEEEEIDRSSLHAFRREGEGGFGYSRKDYVEIGTILKRYKDIDPDRFDKLVNEFSNTFAKDNPNFDKNKFYKFVYGD